MAEGLARPEMYTHEFKTPASFQKNDLGAFFLSLRFTKHIL